MTNRDKPLIDGRFQVVKSIGQGAMGAVYIAMDNTTDEPVALKILKKADIAMRARERFEREIRFLETLSHPNIVEIVSHGHDRDLDLQYYAMELLFGDPISKLSNLGRTSIDLAMLVANQAADGVSIAHQNNIVHRDLKPANLMLVPQDGGTVLVKILDFGLAYDAADDRLTTAGNAPGTLSYMPPEQLRGEDVDERGDLYCLGVVLFEMLTGKPPFSGDSEIVVAGAVLSQTAPRLDELRPDVPKPIANLIAKLLAKSPDDRPENIDVFLDELTDVRLSVGHEPVVVSHTGPSTNPVEDWDLITDQDPRENGSEKTTYSR